VNCHSKEGALQPAAKTRLPPLTIRIRYFTLSSASLSIHAVALLDNTHMHVRHMLIYFYFFTYHETTCNLASLNSPFPPSRDV
jgi:hypothetical protein